MPNIGERVRELRIAKGWEQSDLAKRASMSQSYISMIESGAVNPSYKSLQKLASAFGISESKIFEDNSVVPLDHPALYKHYDQDIKEFLAKEKNMPYVIFAKELEEEGVDKEDLEAIKRILKHRKR